MMSARAPSTWLPRLLFWLATAGALLLISLVLVAPWLDDGTPPPEGQPRLLALFARDATVRRTAIGSAIGLLVTACIFFRPHGMARANARKQTKQPPPSQNVIGA